VLGILFAIVSTYWIRRIFNDGILVVNITIISCYMVYFIAENVDIGIKVSGIIALVSLGLYMAAFGKTRISSEVDSYVEGFWSYAVFCAETIIFVLAGILVGTKVFTIASHITEDDLYKLLILYVCMVFARFISIAFFMRVLPHLGYGLTWKEVYVLTYGGLRGAIGISFSLIVFNDSDYSKQLRDIILFDMAGNVILTLLVNGTTTGPFVRLLGLSSDTKIKQKTYVEFLHKLLDESHYK
jgi:NhaP-type Na+/H+ or K+/H+ antiporter